MIIVPVKIDFCNEQRKKREETENEITSLFSIVATISQTISQRVSIDYQRITGSGSDCKLFSPVSPQKWPGTCRRAGSKLYSYTAVFSK